MYTTLISAIELQRFMQSAAPLRILDCSFDLMDPRAGSQQFETEHLPGALYVHLDNDLSDKTGTDRASGGRHPLPSQAAFVQRMGSLGLHSDTQVVVYDRQGANYCGRLWWMLKWCGHEKVAVLDGGLQAWRAAGGALVAGPSPQVAAQPFEVRPALVAMCGARDIAQRLGSACLTVVDARASARFKGEIEPLDPVAGHIPGALNRPFALNLAPDGRFKAAEDLRREFEQLLAGRDPSTVVHQCGSGVSAIPNLLAMDIAGLGRTALFPGSWSEWCNTEGLPCAIS